MESCVAADASEASAEPKRVRVRKPRAKPEAKPETIADPPPPPSIVVDAPFFAALGGPFVTFKETIDTPRSQVFVLREWGRLIPSITRNRDWRNFWALRGNAASAPQ